MKPNKKILPLIVAVVCMPMWTNPDSDAVCPGLTKLGR